MISTAPTPVRRRWAWWRRRVIIATGVTLVLVAAGMLVVRSIAWTTGWLIGLAALSPYLMALAVPGTIVLLLSRTGWLVGAVSVAVVIACAFTQPALLPRLRSGTAGGAGLNVLTANLRLGQADADSLVATVRQQHVDVLMTQELTRAEADRLFTAGLGRLLPHDELDARDGASGVGLWSRYPLQHPQDVPDFEFAFVTARIAVPASSTPVTLVAAHMPGPWPQPADAWRADIGRLGPTLWQLESHPAPGAIVVGADLNATLDTAQYRRVLRHGLRDAARQSEAGITRTYPAGSWWPPLLAIDHVITYRATATRVRTVGLVGSDHRGLLVRVALDPSGNRP